MLTDLGLTVAREIPREFLAGLISGKYTVHGGVIREAGSIVKHLAVPAAKAAPSIVGFVPGMGIVAAAGGLAANAQLIALSKDVQQILSLSMANTALSGLGLATTIAGVVYLSNRISEIDQKLNELVADTKAIKMILESSQRARLLAALDTYQLACESSEPDKREFLMQARSAFTELTHHYKSQVAGLSKLAEIEASEGHFVVAFLGNAICTSDLGFGDAAAKDLSRHYADWKAMARQHCARLLDLNNGTRLLDGGYLDVLPTKTLIRLMDFARDERRGSRWIDDLRRPLGKKMKLPDFGTVAKEDIEFAKALQARNDVMESYVSHFSFLADRKISATAFSHTLEDVRKQQHGEVLWVSKPTTA